jgi:hypothetical protein
MAEPSEIFDPFLQRVVKVKPGDVVIFKYNGFLERETADRLKAQLAEKFGDIPFVLVNKDFDIAVFRPEPEQKIFVA